MPKVQFIFYYLCGLSLANTNGYNSVINLLCIYLPYN